MYAIIQTGGHQVKVTPGGVATLYGTAGEPGAELTLDQVLVVEKDGGEVLAGAPFVANARVIAVVDGETRGPKIALQTSRTSPIGPTMGDGSSWGEYPTPLAPPTGKIQKTT